MTTHTAQPRPPESTAINYVGDVSELHNALTSAVPEGAEFAFTVTADGEGAVIALSYANATSTAHVVRGEWVVFTPPITAPFMPTVLSDAEMQAAYIVDAQRLGQGA